LCVNKRVTTGCCGLFWKVESGYLGGRDQALEFLEGREPRLSNFLGLYCNLTNSLYFDISFYQYGFLSNLFLWGSQDLKRPGRESCTFSLHLSYHSFVMLWSLFGCFDGFNFQALLWFRNLSKPGVQLDLIIPLLVHGLILHHRNWKEYLLMLYLQMQDLYHLVSVRISCHNVCFVHSNVMHHWNVIYSTSQLSSLVMLKAQNWIGQYGVYQLFMPMLVIMLRLGFSLS